MTIIARGTKAAGAFLSEGLEVSWRAPGETLSEVLEHLLGLGVDGLRIAVQRHGGECTWFTDALEAAGRRSWRWACTTGCRRRRRSRVAACSTPSPRAASTPSPSPRRRRRPSWLGSAAPTCSHRLDEQRRRVRLRRTGDRRRAAVEVGLPHVVSTTPSRLGPMVRTLTEVLPPAPTRSSWPASSSGCRAAAWWSATASSGSRPGSERCSRCCSAPRGAVVSKQVLSERAWDDPAGDHTVEVTVNRLRGKLGPAADALETRNRRGYRLAVAS